MGGEQVQETFCGSTGSQGSQVNKSQALRATDLCQKAAGPPVTWGPAHPLVLTWSAEAACGSGTAASTGHGGRSAWGPHATHGTTCAAWMTLYAGKAERGLFSFSKAFRKKNGLFIVPLWESRIPLTD